MNNKTELLIKKDAETNVKELISYLSQIEALYSFLQKRPELIDSALEKSQSKDGVDLERFGDDLLESLLFSKYSSKNLGHLLGDNKINNLRKSDLSIIHISQNSPLLIVFGTVVLPLVGALIISGGKANIKILGSQLNIELPALGEGLLKIQEFRERFRENRKEQRLLPNEREVLMIAAQSRDLRSEIRDLKRARDVEDIDTETKNQLTLEIYKKEQELRNLRK